MEKLGNLSINPRQFWGEGLNLRYFIPATERMSVGSFGRGSDGYFGILLLHDGAIYYNKTM